MSSDVGTYQTKAAWYIVMVCSWPRSTKKNYSLNTKKFFTQNITLRHKKWLQNLTVASLSTLFKNALDHTN